MIEVRPHLRAIERIDSADTRGDFVRLDRNDGTTALTDEALREIFSRLGPEVFANYPDPQPLNHRIAEELGLPQDHVLATNGSDAAIRRAFHAYVGPGDRVVFPAPTYAMYGVYSRVFEAEAVTLDYGEDRRLDVEAFLALIADGPRMVCIANPDQPTGAALSEDDLRRIVAAAQAAGSLCLVDEAYYPFHPVSAAALIERYDNLLVTRSFSKAAGLGGLRLGFACGQPHIMEGLGKVRGLHEVSQLAVVVGLYFLDHPELLAANLEQLEAGRQALADFARGHNFGFPACPANFQLVALPEAIDSRAVVAALRERGFLIKGGLGAPAVRNCLRISLAAPEVMTRFVTELEAVLVELDEPSAAAGAGS